jgi:biotin carboxylase
MATNKEKQITRIIGKLYDQMIKTVHDSEKPKEKNIVLYVGKVYGHMITAIKTHGKKNKKKYRIALIHDSKEKLDAVTQHQIDRIDVIISCDTNNPSAIQAALHPYHGEILAVTSRAEDKIPLMSRIIPHVPYLNTPTAESLAWSSDKELMRDRLLVHNPEINPRFTVVTENNRATLKKIEEEVGYPLMVKPAGLAASRLVHICFHREELESVLKMVFKKIDGVYKSEGGKWQPKLLVEQFIEGDMYSIDAYVDAKGKVQFCPMVEIKTGKSIGFDDFFGYQQMTPTSLSKESIMTAEFVAEEAIKAMGLRSTTAHVELFKTEQGWKIIELGPRMGGFRHMMYEFSYGINHVVNDILIRIPEKINLPKKVNGYTVAMKFFAKKEGALEKLTGIKKIQDLKSFKRIYIHKQTGDQCLYAKHGGSSVFDLVMFNKDRSELLADIRRVEKTVEIETK